MKIKSFYNLLKSYIYVLFYKRPKIMSSKQTVEYILKNKCSIGRMGDGELTVALGYNLNFQKVNKELSAKILNLKTTDNFLLCLPDIFYNNKKIKNDIWQEGYKFWKGHKFRFEGFWRKYYSKNNYLGNAFISRFYLRYKDKSNVGNYVKLIKKLWDKRDIVFVEGKNSRLGVGNDLFDNSNSIKRILCPTTNAFDKYNEILNEIKNKVDKNSLIILALGPTATVLAYDLSQIGYQALDLGHIDIEYEWFLLKTDKKVPIPHKHVNECNSLGDNNLGQFEMEYLSQIIGEIK